MSFNHPTNSVKAVKANQFPKHADRNHQTLHKVLPAFNFS